MTEEKNKVQNVLVELDASTERALGLWDILADGVIWPKLFLMVGVGDIYDQSSRRVLQYCPVQSPLADIAKRYGLKYRHEPPSSKNQYIETETLYICTVTGNWVPWARIQDKKEFLIYGNTKDLNAWFSITRPELITVYANRLCSEIGTIAAKYGCAISPNELIAMEEYQDTEEPGKIPGDKYETEKTQYGGSCNDKPYNVKIHLAVTKKTGCMG